jgi:hypothetical protein
MIAPNVFFGDFSMAQKKEYEDFVTDLTVACNSRIEIVKTLVDAFLNEKKGYWKEGKQVATRYRYYVETLQGGKRIYLKRPAAPKFGVDFQVYVEKFDGIKDKRPAHQHIFDDMRLKLKESPEQKEALLTAVERVWNCEDPDKICFEIPLKFTKGLSCELVLKAVKWLFIEQDVTYWNYDGRMMLWNSIKKECE